MDIKQIIHSFQQLVQEQLAKYISKQPGESLPAMETWEGAFDDFLGRKLRKEESLVFCLALIPHIYPQALDLFFFQNKELDRPYTAFGGWRGKSHAGFLPTGETAAFLLSAGDPGGRKEIMRIVGKEHWFYKEQILWLEGQGEGEPYLSGLLRVSDEILAQLFEQPYHPEYTTSFPAKLISTPLEWDDLVVNRRLRQELDELAEWLTNEKEIREKWSLDRIVKPGYRCLFHGLPGTGKTLTAMLLGKKNNRKVYRVDLSMIVSKYIGETEKNLAAVFDKAAYHNWILFFDEADAIFGKRTETQSSNDRHANQEVAYLLQRIEDFPGVVILATNLKTNVDEAFNRRFQSVLYFPMPDENERFLLWQKMIPSEWIENEELLFTAATYELSGGSMINIVRYCALKLYKENPPLLKEELLIQAIRKELQKEGKMIINRHL